MLSPRLGIALLLALLVTAVGRAEAVAPVDDATTAAPTAVAPTLPPDTTAPAAPSEPAVVSAPILTTAASGGPALVKVIPVREAIGKPVLYVLRRGMKEAQAEGVGTVVIDMETPGGELGVTLEIMEAIDKFEGETLVYVNKEAISAGAIISSAADEIFFAPGAVIGAAAAVSGGGAEIPETMKQKINSYLTAKIRSVSEGKGRRAEVIKAMMDADFEFRIGEEVIKPKGELLSLTAEEAARAYGEPPAPLLSAGTYGTLEALLEARFGKDGYTLRRLEVTWSERVASWLAGLAPLLMGAGLLCVFVELKTPGFGIFGVLGGILLGLVFFGHHAAGLSGHEGALIFLLGLALIAIELFLIPGTLVAGLLGALFILGGLVWSMVDVWPGEMPALDADTFLEPMLDVGLALIVAAVGGVLLARFLPRGWFWDKLVLQTAVGDTHSAAAASPWGDAAAPEGGDGLLGSTGVAVSALRPMGEVEVAGRRHEARADLGTLERGDRVRVIGRSGRVLLVAKEEAA